MVKMNTSTKLCQKLGTKSTQIASAHSQINSLGMVPGTTFVVITHPSTQQPDYTHYKLTTHPELESRIVKDLLQIG
jgi:hypothetical protein